MSLQIEYFKAYQLLQNNWREKVQFSFCEHLVTRRWHTGDYNLFLGFKVDSSSVRHSPSCLWFGLSSPSSHLMFLTTAFRFWNTDPRALLRSRAPHTHNYIPLYTSALPAPVLSFCEKSNSLLCHLIELLRLLLFYLSVCWSLREVGGRPSPALSVKVSELWMKMCRSDECHRLTANFHQRSCGWGGAEMWGARGPLVSLRILHFLSDLLTHCVEIWPRSLLRSRVY